MSPRAQRNQQLRYAKALLLLLAPQPKPAAKIGPMQPTLAQQLAEEPEWDSPLEDENSAASDS